MEHKPELLRVLLIEDNDNDAALILRELKRANGFEILMDVVSTEHDMRSVLQRKVFDIVLCDYFLPSFSMAKAVQILTEFDLNVPVILVSGTITEEMGDKMASTNVYEFVSKHNLAKLGPVIKRELLLASANDKILHVLIRALEYRDLETLEHSERVVKKSAVIARVLGMSEIDVAHLRRGALLHDVGKIGIPDAVLLKKDRLTKEERLLIQKHPQLGYDLLKDIPFLKRALDIPYCHHEHWDGSGYPRGLKGEQIPLTARIFAVIDNYDALISDRPYRKALSKDFALKFIAEQKGKLFDPEVVDAFLKTFGNENDTKKEKD